MHCTAGHALAPPNGVSRRIAALWPCYEAELRQRVGCEREPSRKRSLCRTTRRGQYLPYETTFLAESRPQGVCASKGIREASGKAFSFELAKRTAEKTCSTAVFTTTVHVRHAQSFSRVVFSSLEKLVFQEPCPTLLASRNVQQGPTHIGAYCFAQLLCIE